MSTVTYLDRILDPVTDSFTPEFARRIVGLRADDELQAEIDVLRQRRSSSVTGPQRTALMQFLQTSGDGTAISRRHLTARPVKQYEILLHRHR